MPSEKDKILKSKFKFLKYMKSDEMLYIISAVMESSTKKIDRREYNPENSSTTKIGEHIPCGY